MKLENRLASWSVTNEEYAKLEEKFGNLCQYIAWQLIRKNNNNNHTDEQIDIVQELRIALVVAAAYYKRQMYIESCLSLCGYKDLKDNYQSTLKDPFLGQISEKLQDLWDNKTRHGANRQKFGPYQEKILDKIIIKTVPRSKRPSKKRALLMDAKFITYCKAITWNKQKNMGKKITREKTIRSGMASLSDYDYLGATTNKNNHWNLLA